MYLRLSASASVHVARALRYSNEVTQVQLSSAPSGESNTGKRGTCAPTSNTCGESATAWCCSLTLHANRAGGGGSPPRDLHAIRITRMSAFLIAASVQQHLLQKSSHFSHKGKGEKQPDNNVL